jgi:4-hydroxy-tetrahydrodipicolinate reductase
MTRVILHGAGRMSKAIYLAASGRDDLEIVAVVAPNRPDWLDTLPYFNLLDDVDIAADVLLDFTLPEGTITAAAWCAQANVAIVSGVTGLTDDALTALDKAAEDVSVLWSPNMSIGVSLLSHFSAQLAAQLPPNTQIHIEDIHHQWKKDAPSGTALSLGKAIGQGLPYPAEIHYESIREGEVIGQHEVTFKLPGETITLRHEAVDRNIFANGAIEAAIWLGQQVPGRYTSALHRS